MKYMQAGGFQSQPLMRLTLTLTLVLLVVFWGTSFGLYFSKMNLDPASVVDYYRGSEEGFRPPRTLGSMLEVTHGHLIMMALVLLLLTHLVIFAPFADRAKKLTIWSAFGAAFMSESAGWLVRFISPGFAPLKVLGFLSLQFLLFTLMVILGWTLLRPSQRPEHVRLAKLTEVHPSR